MIEIAPKFGEKFYRPIVEIFAGIPSVVYGWVGLDNVDPGNKKIIVDFRSDILYWQRESYSHL